MYTIRKEFVFVGLVGLAVHDSNSNAVRVWGWFVQSLFDCCSERHLSVERHAKKESREYNDVLL